MVFSWMKVELGIDFKIEYTSCPALAYILSLDTTYYAFVIHFNKWNSMLTQFTDYVTPMFLLDDRMNVTNYQKCKNASVSGYFIKSEPLTLLLKAVLFPGLRKFWLTETSKISLEALPNKEIYKLLTPREKEVFKLLAEGYGYKEVGFKMGISGKTVLTHRDKVMKKMNCNSIVDLIKEALRLRLIKL